MNRVRAVALLVFSGVLAVSSQACAQVLDIQSPPKKKCDFFLSDMLWGTDWNSISFNRVIGKEVFSGISYEGWSDWRRVSTHIGTQKKLLESEGTRAQTWSALEITRISWPIVGEVEYVPSVNVGLELVVDGLDVADSISVVGACRVSSDFWQWTAEAKVIRGPYSILLLFGRTRLFSGWSTEYAYKIGRATVYSRVEGPWSAFSVGLRFTLVNSEVSVSHRNRQLGGSSEFELRW